MFVSQQENNNINFDILSPIYEHTRLNTTIKNNEIIPESLNSFSRYRIASKWLIYAQAC